MNKVIMMGRLTRDPEIRYSQGQNAMAVATFSIAVDRRFRREGEPEADFFNCTAFRRQAEFVEKFLKKGVKVVVIGSMQNDNYTNKEGQKVYSTRIIVDEIEFAESKAASAANSGNVSNYEQPATPTGAQEGFMSIPGGLEDELPFA